MRFLFFLIQITSHVLAFAQSTSTCGFGAWLLCTACPVIPAHFSLIQACGTAFIPHYPAFIVALRNLLGEDDATGKQKVQQLLEEHAGRCLLQAAVEFAADLGSAVGKDVLKPVSSPVLQSEKANQASFQKYNRWFFCWVRRERNVYRLSAIVDAYSRMLHG